MSKPVFIHSDITRSLPLYKEGDREINVSDSCHMASEFLLNKYGDNLSFPAFNYDFGGSLVFDVDNDSSQVGSLSEHIRLSEDYCRSPIPFFSVLSKNKDLCKYSPECHPFGKGSFFEWLHINNGKIIGFGTRTMFTFLHYIEELIPGGPMYRYKKEFNGLLKTGEGNKEVVCKIHVRPKNGITAYDFIAIEQDLRLEGILVDDDKYGISCSMECSEVLPYMLSKYENDPLYGLTKESKSILMKLTDNCSSRIKESDDVVSSDKNNMQDVVNTLREDEIGSLSLKNFSIDVVNVVSSVLTEEEITIESNMDNTYTWDSLNHMAIIVSLKNQLGIDFSPSEVANMTSIGNILKKAYEGK